MHFMPAMPRLLAAIGLALLSWQAQAGVFELDSFSVERNRIQIFNDTFSDGAPPPSAPNFNDDSAASYSVFGSPGPESGGLLKLNTANGGLTTNASGDARRTIRAALNTNTSNADADLGRGLKDDDRLRLRGFFNVGVPVGPVLNGYGIRFSDRGPAGIFQAADLQVVFNPATGKAEIRWVLQDFANGQVTTVGSTDLLIPDGADQIALQIERPSLDSKDFFATWFFLDGGLVKGTGTFASGIGLFDGERFVRAEFLAFEGVPAVPLPGTLWLLGAGLLAGLGFAQRRQA
jgi:PEP-CTERM motif